MSEQSVSVIRGNPSPEETAAVAAAIELYAAELRQVSSAAETGSEMNGWQRAALREGVEARRIVANVWGAAPVGPS